MCPTWTCQSAWFWFCWTEQTSRPHRCRFEFIRSLQRGLQEYIYQPERCISGFKKSVSHHSNEEMTCLNLDLSPKCCKQWKQEQEPVHKASLDLKTYRFQGPAVETRFRSLYQCDLLICSLDACVYSKWTYKGSESLKSCSCIRQPRLLSRMCESVEPTVKLWRKKLLIRRFHFLLFISPSSDGRTEKFSHRSLEFSQESENV